MCQKSKTFSRNQPYTRLNNLLNCRQLSKTVPFYTLYGLVEYTPSSSSSGVHHCRFAILITRSFMCLYSRSEALFIFGQQDSIGVVTNTTLCQHRVAEVPIYWCIVTVDIVTLSQF